MSRLVCQPAPKWRKRSWIKSIIQRSHVGFERNMPHIVPVAGKSPSANGLLTILPTLPASALNANRADESTRRRLYRMPSGQSANPYDTDHDKPVGIYFFPPVHRNKAPARRPVRYVPQLRPKAGLRRGKSPPLPARTCRLSAVTILATMHRTRPSRPRTRFAPPRPVCGQQRRSRPFPTKASTVPGIASSDLSRCLPLFPHRVRSAADLLCFPLGRASKTE